MTAKDFRLLSLAESTLLGDNFIEAGSLEWLLRDFPELLFPSGRFVGWRSETRKGRAAWPAPTPMTQRLLRHAQAGQTRVGAVRPAATDPRGVAALRLPWDENPPSDKTLRELEASVQQEHPDVGRSRIELASEHGLRHPCSANGR